MSDEPRVIQANVSASVGGKVQIVNFGKLSNSFNFSINRTYSIPEDWTEEQVEAFQRNKLIDFRELLDPLAQAEQDALLEQSDWYEGNDPE